MRFFQEEEYDSLPTLTQGRFLMNPIIAGFNRRIEDNGTLLLEIVQHGTPATLRGVLENAQQNPLIYFERELYGRVCTLAGGDPNKLDMYDLLDVFFQNYPTRIVGKSTTRLPRPPLVRASRNGIQNGGVLRV